VIWRGQSEIWQQSLLIAYFLQCNGLAIGPKPATDFIDGEFELDEDGYIVTVPGKAEISVPGLFACGEVQDKLCRHAITAVGSVFYFFGGTGVGRAYILALGD
jgi:hypothetical protein